jgi:hypothetical protein
MHSNICPANFTLLRAWGSWPGWNPLHTFNQIFSLLYILCIWNKVPFHSLEPRVFWHKWNQFLEQDLNSNWHRQYFKSYSKEEGVPFWTESFLFGTKRLDILSLSFSLSIYVSPRKFIYLICTLLAPPPGGRGGVVANEFMNVSAFSPRHSA